MTRVPMAAGILLAGLLLFACSKRDGLVVTGDKVGPISVATPFDAAAVAALFPQLEVSAGISSALEPGAHVIRVSDNGKTVLELYPTGDGARVASVLILSDIVRDENGVHIGSAYRDIFPPAKPTGCMAGATEKRGRIYCPQPNSNRIIYEMQGLPPAPDGQVPPPEALADWRVTAILWDGDDAAIN
ncbi:DUF1131 family protein [Parvibaculum sp.]|uniref:DUF1131 family protein n=1 Tax=Parvibaculum sp. TaxID=2024848 RepID=UPI00321171C7